MTGRRIGSYQVLGELGQGGMGTVYRATDTKLGRQVAIKVLRDEIARDQAYLSRFAREARLLAGLNHPNIATVYGLEESDGATAIVMELVEGPTLADRIAGRAVPADEATAIARQIAEALEAAHEQGIIHRDLKPANIKIRPDGKVKVLDFGLAKSVAAPAGPDEPTASLDTEHGRVLGTPAYMSPEQARGEALDRRSDIWSFGCVLYEMLTGRRPFDGSSTQEALASVLAREPDWSLLPAGLSSTLAVYLRRCVEKTRGRRLRDIGDMRLALEGAFDTGQSPPAVARSRPDWWRVALVALALGLTAVVALVLVMRPRGDVEQAVSRLSIPLPLGQQFFYPGRHMLAIAPSGTHLAYIAGTGLWIRHLDQLEATQVPGAALEARSPFFSPDGESVGYFAAGMLRRVAVAGGNPVDLTSADNPWGAYWADDGFIYYGQGDDGIWRVPESGGSGEQILRVGEGESAHGPQLLPDGDGLLFTLLPAGVGTWNRAQIILQSLRAGQREVLVEGGRDARYVASGHLVYGVNGDLMSMPFDITSRRPTGSAVPVVRGVRDSGTFTGAVQFGVATNGTLVYMQRPEPKLTPVWVDREGRKQPIQVSARSYLHPKVSPDGTRIAIEVEEAASSDIWIVDSDRSQPTPLSLGQSVDSDPIWTPDGLRVVFSSVREGGGLFWRAADGSGGVTRVTAGAPNIRANTWTPAGELVYEYLEGARILLLPLGPDPTARQIEVFDAPAYYNELLPALSPDGRWLAYQSTEASLSQVYVRPFPDTQANRWQISTTGGSAPLWSRDGRELYYRSDPQGSNPTLGSMMAVRVGSGPAFTHSSPEELFNLRDYRFPGLRGIQYDVAPDGRFLLLEDDQRNETVMGEQIVVVQHWFDDLAKADR